MLRILVVSANPLARAGMAALLARMSEVIVLGAEGTPEPAGADPDVALLDVGEAEPDQLEAIGRLLADLPGVPVVALATMVRERVGTALSLGAAALLPVDVDPSALRAALEAARNGLVLAAREDLPALVPAEASAPSVAAPPVEALTTRELEVLQWLARGLTNGQIARRLEISEHTVKFHVASILGKLGARSRADAVARGLGLGWILL